MVPTTAEPFENPLRSSDLLPAFDKHLAIHQGPATNPAQMQVVPGESRRLTPVGNPKCFRLNCFAYTPQPLSCH